MNRTRKKSVLRQNPTDIYHHACMWEGYRLTRRTTLRALGRQSFPLHHDALVANIDEHLEPLDLLILLLDLLLQLLCLSSPGFLDLLDLCLCVRDLCSEFGAELLFEGHGWLLVEGRELLHGGGFDAGRVALDGCAGVVDVAGKVADAGVFAV